MDLWEIVKRPIITEKGIAGASDRKYTFEVDKEAGKKEIARAVEKLFQVKVKAVQVANIKGKKVRVGRRRRLAQRSDWKKARVTLKEGEKIEMFEEFLGSK